MLRSITKTAKKLAIATGLYRPARYLTRLFNPHHGRAFQADIALYRSLLQPGALCFDVGANIGDKSEALLEAGARVVAFEPNRLLMPELSARCKHQKNWTLIEAALGSSAAIATLYAAKSHGQSSLAQDWMGKTIASFQVPVVTLDSAIACFGIPAYCKIDVEGWELEVLKGLTQPLPLISFEFHLNVQGIKSAVSCLESLTRFGPGLVNITPAEGAEFHFQEWMPLAQFLEWFPGDLKQTLPGNPYGDNFVKKDAL